MTEIPETSSFGELLRYYRERSVDKRVRMRLSQVQFAAKLSQKTGLIVTRNRVGNWESSKTRIPVYDRKILMAILNVLHEYGGIAKLDVIDYVVIHELAHLRVKNHSSKFWREVENIFPEYKAKRKWLRLHGEKLIL